MLKRINRLAKRKEFNYLYNNGIAKHTNNLTIVYLSTKNRATKIGFAVAKKVGKAHTRNLIKRRLRAIVKDIVPTIPDNYNIVFIAKASIVNIPFNELKTEIEILLNKTDIRTK